MAFKVTFDANGCVINKTTIVRACWCVFGNLFPGIAIPTAVMSNRNLETILDQNFPDCSLGKPDTKEIQDFGARRFDGIQYVPCMWIDDSTVWLFDNNNKKVGEIVNIGPAERRTA